MSGSEPILLLSFPSEHMGWRDAGCAAAAGGEDPPPPPPLPPFPDSIIWLPWTPPPSSVLNATGPNHLCQCARIIPTLSSDHFKLFNNSSHEADIIFIYWTGVHQDAFKGELHVSCFTRDAFKFDFSARKTTIIFIFFYNHLQTISPLVTV